MAVSKQVISQALGHAVALGVGYLASRQGLHMNPAQAAEVAAVASMVVGPVAGHLTKEEPAAETMIADFERLFQVVTESGTNPRSALYGAVRPANGSPAPVTPDTQDEVK